MTQLTGIQILTTKAQFKDMAIVALVAEFNQRIKLKEARIKAEIRQLVRVTLEKTNTYRSLIGGKTGGSSLMAHFGFPFSQATSIVDGIVSVVLDDIVFTTDFFFKNGARIVGKFTIRILPHGHANVLASKFGSYISQPSDERIDWIEWLLLRGSETIITDFGINFEGFPLNVSRSKQAVMIDLDLAKGEETSPKKIVAWKVPSVYSGTVKDNWLTRALDTQQVSTKICNIIAKALK